MNPDPYQLDEHCVSANFPWSIVDSSTPNAHLAAVLAGFMVTAIVFLLRRDTDQQDAASRAHTIAMFLTGVVILGLDSYVFGSLASMHPVTQTITSMDPATHVQTAIQAARPEAHYVCALVWTHGMVASGMLAVGGTLLVAGLGWTTTQFARNSESKSAWFACLGNIATWAITVTCLAALFDTASMYVHSMAAQPFISPLDDGTPVIAVITAAAAIVCTVLIAIRTVGLWRRIRTQGWGNEADPRYRALGWANFFTILLAVMGPVLVVGFLDEPRSPATSIMWTATAGCVVIPCLVFVLIAYSVPGPPILCEKRTASQGERADDANAGNAQADDQQASSTSPVVGQSI